MLAASKIGRLEKGVQEIQAFVADRLEHNSAFDPIAQDLDRIAAALKVGKLTVLITGQNQTLAQSLQSWIKTRKTLLDVYQLKLELLSSQPEPAQPKASAALIYQTLDADEANLIQIRYELPPDRSIQIGRGPDCDIFLNTKLYPRVSWHHVEVQPILRPEVNNGCSGWMLNDLNSTNGTYVNGSSEKLQAGQALQMGDRIVLAPSSTNESALEFIFECQSYPTSSAEPAYQSLTDCDVACLIMNSKQPLSKDERYFIQRVSEIQIIRLVIAVDVAEGSFQVDQLAALEAEIKHQDIDLKFELFALCLTASPAVVEEAKPRTSFQSRTRKQVKPVAIVETSANLETMTEKVEPPPEHNIEELCNFLELTATRKPEEVLVKRLSTQTQRQIVLIEQCVSEKENVVRHKLQQEESKPRKIEHHNLGLKTALKQLGENRDVFFKYVKPYVNRSKDTLLDEYLPRSILHRVQLYVNDMQVVEFKRGGYKYIQLKPKNAIQADEFTTVSRFCQLELKQWAIAEWEQVNTVYEGGLADIFQRTHTALDQLPNLTLPASLLPLLAINFQTLFQETLVDLPCEIRYRDISVGGYIIKTLRTNWMLFASTLSIVGVLGIVLKPKNDIPKAFQQFSGFLSGLLKLPFGITNFIAPLLLLTPLCLWLTHSYLQEKSSKVEEATAKLRKELLNYYQSLAKRLTERIVQDFSSELDLEKRRLEEAHDRIVEHLATHPEGEKGQALTQRTDLEHLKREQKSLQEERVALQKLKRFV